MAVSIGHVRPDRHSENVVARRPLNGLAAVTARIRAAWYEDWNGGKKQE
jgi:hypothetical protein